MRIALSLAAAGPLSPASAGQAAADDAGQMSEQASLVVTWVNSSGDNRDLPFIVIDKIAASVLVFDAEGQFVGATPALLGSAVGDETAPGIGDRELSDIEPEDRTTPAGRFLAAFGPATGGKKVLWIDYDSAVALHPVITGNLKEHRLERLRSPSAQDNRITFGCINISPTFYQKVVRTVFNDKGGVVYILPEDRPLREIFPSFRLSRRALLEAAIGR